MLFISNVVVFLAFTIIYWIMEKRDRGKHFGKDFDPVYFAIITQTTVGFGDSHPETRQARYVTSLHAILTLIFTLYYI